MLLQGAQFDFAGHTLEIVPLGKRSDLPKPSKEIKSTPVDAAAMAAPAPIMKPRPPKAANRKKVLAVPSTQVAQVKTTPASIERSGLAASEGMKGQEHFRKMLESRDGQMD